MDRKQFMARLEQLLQGLPETERLEALNYFENYFDDAGPEKEADLLRELESPERTAEIILTNFKDSSGDYGQYSERGYEDVRLKENGEMPDKYTAGGKARSAPIICAIILLVFLLPFLKGSLWKGLGLVLGLLMLPFLLVAALAGFALALVVKGIWYAAVGLGLCITHPVGGLMRMSAGCILAALGGLIALGIVWAAVRLLPRWIRSFKEYHHPGRKTV